MQFRTELQNGIMSVIALQQFLPLEKQFDPSICYWLTDFRVFMKWSLFDVIVLAPVTSRVSE